MDESLVDIILVLGPHARVGDLGRLRAADAIRELLHARVTIIAAATEHEVVEALGSRCDAVVLDPGALERFSGLAADALRRSAVPVIVARGRHGEGADEDGSKLVVTPAATASIAGGGDLAYEAAVEAAAWFAWEGRPMTPRGRRGARSAPSCGPLS